MDVGLDYEEWGKKFLHRMKSDNPLDLTNRESFSTWMCNQHNLFNKDLGKDQFDCTYENLKRRWGPP